METVSGKNGARAPGVAARLAEGGALDQIVAELRKIERQTGIERTLAIGELVLTQFFGGNPEIWRDRRRNKNNSIRRLAERKDCPFRRSALNEAVGVYVAVVGLPCVRTFGHVSASHVASVLRLPSHERECMLRNAEDGQWSVRELRQRVILLRRSGGERRGRPRVDSTTRLVSSLGAAVGRLSRAMTELDKAGPFSAESRWELCQQAHEVSAISARLLELGGPDVARVRVSELVVRGRTA